jgi:hypothetical protein
VRILVESAAEERTNVLVKSRKEFEWSRENIVVRWSGDQVQSRKVMRRMKKATEIERGIPGAWRNK